MKRFEEPALFILTFGVKDIITTSDETTPAEPVKPTPGGTGTDIL